MDEVLFENTKLAAYFLWEYTKTENALNHWYCAEDIACFLEASGILHEDSIINIKKRGMYDYSYINFIRNIAFRIYVYTNVVQKTTNWYVSERIVNNLECCKALITIAQIYNKEKANVNFITGLKSEKVRSFYNSINSGFKIM